MTKKSTKKFLKRPEYPGGKEALQKYVKENLKYPEKALEAKIEGIVFLSAQINDNGVVLDVKVEKKVGYGCDEEALRLIKNIQFGKVTNRGVRVKTRKKFRIEFKLPPKKSVQYNITQKKEQRESPKKAKTYSYTIQIKS